MRSKTTLKPDIYQLVSLCGGLSHSTYTKENNLGRVIHKPGIEKTMFIEWMVLCR
ncbi:unnamed protein product, partial [Brassica oleracea var. botrytis]